ncbi:WHG domain-containing protein [Streptomyces sp. ARC32]
MLKPGPRTRPGRLHSCSPPSARQLSPRRAYGLGRGKTASLYSHLRNAHDLKTRIALLALEELADLASAAVAGRVGKDALTAFANAYRDLAEPHQTHAVRLLGSVFSGFVGLEGAGGFSHSSPDAQESWTEILDALDSLLRTWPTAS